MITFFDTLNFLCAKILGYKRRNCIATIGISLKSMTNLLPENRAPQLKA